MSKESLEKLKKEFEKELKKLDETLKKQAEEEKKNKVIYKTYYIERDLPKKEDDKTT